jgi:hypothetical protein
MSLNQTKQQIFPIKSIGPASRRSIRSEVIFGTPSSGCEGVGICRIIPVARKVACKCPSITAQINVTPAGRLRMRFSKESMEPRFMKRHFGWMLFQVLEAYEIPQSVVRKLNLDESQGWIYPGIYTVWESAEWLVVEF